MDTRKKIAYQIDTDLTSGEENYQDAIALLREPSFENIDCALHQLTLAIEKGCVNATKNKATFLKKVYQLLETHVAENNDDAFQVMAYLFLYDAIALKLKPLDSRAQHIAYELSSEISIRQKFATQSNKPHRAFYWYLLLIEDTELPQDVDEIDLCRHLQTYAEKHNNPGMLLINAIRSFSTTTSRAAFQSIIHFAQNGVPLAQQMASDLILVTAESCNIPYEFLPKNLRKEFVQATEPRSELECKTFGFDEVIAFFKKGSRIFSYALYQQMINVEFKEMQKNNAHAFFISAIRELDGAPHRALELMQKAAKHGNMNAVYIMAFLVLRTHKDFTREDVLHFKNETGTESFEEEKSRKKITLQLLENTAVCKFLYENYLTTTSLTIACKMIEACHKHIFINKYTLDAETIAYAKLLMKTFPMPLDAKEKETKEPLKTIHIPSTTLRFTPMHEADLEYNQVLQELNAATTHLRKQLFIQRLIKLDLEKQHPSAPMRLAYMNIDRKKYLVAVELIEKAAKRGNIEALTILNGLFDGIKIAPAVLSYNQNEVTTILCLLNNPEVITYLRKKYDNAEGRILATETIIHKITHSIMKSTFKDSNTNLQLDVKLNSKSKFEDTMTTKTWLTKILSSLPEPVKDEKGDVAFGYEKIQHLEKHSTLLSQLKSFPIDPTVNPLDVLAYMIFYSNLMFTKNNKAHFQQLIFLKPTISPIIKIALQLLDIAEYQKHMKFYNTEDAMDFATKKLLAYFQQKTTQAVAFANKRNKDKNKTKERRTLLENESVAVNIFIHTIAEDYLLYKTTSTVIPSSKISTAFFSKKLIKDDENKEDKADKKSEPLQPLRIILDATYRSDVCMSEDKVEAIRSQLYSFTTIERSREFWRLLRQGFLYGKGKEFFKNLNDFALFDILFPPCSQESKANTPEVLDAIANRLDDLDYLLTHHHRNFADINAHTNVFFAILISKELYQTDIISKDMIETIRTKYGIPPLFFKAASVEDHVFRVEPHNEHILYRIQREKARFKRFFADSISSQRLSRP